MFQTNKRRAYGALAGVVAAGGLWFVGAAGASPNPEPKEPLRPQNYAGQIDESRVTQSAGDAVDATLSGLGTPAGMRVNIRDQAAQNSDESLGKQWLDIRVAHSDDPILAVHNVWEGFLLEGAVADRLAGPDVRVLSEVFSGSSITSVDSNGVETDEGGGLGKVAPGQVFSGQVEALTDDQIKAEVSGFVQNQGLPIPEIKVTHPLGPAVSVTLTVPNSRSIHGGIRPLIAGILQDPARYEGLFLAVRLDDGTALIATASALRSGGGGFWVNPKFATALGVQTGHTPVS